MSTTATATANEPLDTADEADETPRSRPRLGRLGLGAAGLIAALVSIWGGIAPYVGPTFGYSGDGTASWHWSLAHSLLALVPGAVGLALGVFVMLEARGIDIGRGRLSLATAGVLLMACGAWFAIGPLAWPVLSGGTSYFVGGSHLTVLEYVVGY
jgi:hypothetical protein